MDVLFELAQASAHEVLARLPDPPSYSSVRTLLAVLERKGHVRHRRDGLKYIYAPTQSTERAGRRALAHIVDVFFAGSASRALATLIDAEKPDAQELSRLEELIARAKREGR